MRTRTLIALLAITLVTGLPALAGTLAGNTTINFSDDLVALGLTIAPVGSASVEGQAATFPITGGDFDPSTVLGTIEHVGSGVDITDGPNVFRLNNLILNATSGRIFAEAIVNGINEGTPSVFLIGDGFALTFSLPAAALASAAFEIDFGVLLSLEVGIATVDVVPDTTDPIPEPASWLLLLSGVGMLLAGTRGKSLFGRRS